MVDFQNAKTQHHSSFLRRHIELNSYVKLATSAVDFLRSYSSDPDILNDKISKLVIDAGERWTRSVYTNPHDDLNMVRQQISEMAIVRVFSAFNVFRDKVSGSYNKYKNNPGEDTPNTVEGIYSSFCWDSKNISYLFPVLKFYDISRHCIAHQMGDPNSELSSLLKSEDFLNAVNNWPTVIAGRSLSPPPVINNSGDLELAPHHPITYSDVCLRVVRDIDQKLFNTLGLPYFVKKIADDSIINAHLGTTYKQRDAYVFIRHMLGSEYGIEQVSIPDIRNSLGGDGSAQIYFHKYKRLIDNQYLK